MPSLHGGANIASDAATECSTNALAHEVPDCRSEHSANGDSNARTDAVSDDVADRSAKQSANALAHEVPDCRSERSANGDSNARTDAVSDDVTDRSTEHSANARADEKSDGFTRVRRRLHNGGRSGVRTDKCSLLKGYCHRHRPLWLRLGLWVQRCGVHGVHAGSDSRAFGVSDRGAELVTNRNTHGGTFGHADVRSISCADHATDGVAVVGAHSGAEPRSNDGAH
jgi:hypothetical protein